MDTEDIAESMERCFISTALSDINYAPANVVDVIDQAARNLGKIAHAITPTDVAPLVTPSAGRVGSLTESVIYVAENLSDIADAIRDLAEAVREQRKRQ